MKKLDLLNKMCYHIVTRRSVEKGSDTPEVMAAAGVVSVCVGKCGRSKFMCMDCVSGLVVL